MIHSGIIVRLAEMINLLFLVLFVFVSCCHFMENPSSSLESPLQQMTVPVEEMVTQWNKIVIACLVTDKKYRKMGGDEGLRQAIARSSGKNDEIVIGQVLLEDLVEGNDITENFLKVLKRDFGFREGFKVILVHKYSDYFRVTEATDKILKLRDWLSESRFKVLDEPEMIDILSNRVQTGLLVREMCKFQGFESRGMHWPEFKVNWDGKKKDLEYPVIVKPVDACATDEAHWMTLLNSSPQLNNNNSNSFNFTFACDGECLVQKFYEHFGVLYKVYVIGGNVEIVARPSITARNAGALLRFNTHKFKVTEGDLSEELFLTAMKRIEPFRDLVEDFARELKKKLQLTWFGIDVIIPEDGEVKVAVIDVNYMPGYDGIKELSEKLIKAILD